MLQQAASPHINSAQTLTVPPGEIRSAGKVTPAIIARWKTEEHMYRHRNSAAAAETEFMYKEFMDKQIYDLFNYYF